MTRRPWDVTEDMFLSLAEANALLAHVRGRAVRSKGAKHGSALLDDLIIECLLFSGLRNSEFCRLTLGDTVVGLRQSVFVVRGSEERTVHLPESVSQLILRYLSLVRPEALKAGDPRQLEQALVLNERGRPYERTALYRRVVRILTDTGLGERASVQLLRHTYGYLAYLRTGGNLLFVQRQLGHAHPMVTSVYARFVEERYDRMAERLYLASGDSSANPLTINVE